MKKEEKPPEVEENPGRYVARALCRLRRESGLTQREVAERACELQGLDPSRKSVLESQLSDFERGRAKPSHDALVAVLAALAPDGRCDFGRYQEALDEVRGISGPAPTVPTVESLPAAATLTRLETEMAQVRAELVWLRKFREHLGRLLGLAREPAPSVGTGSNGGTSTGDALASVDYVFGDRR